MAIRKYFGVMLMGAALAALPSAAQSKPDPGPAPCTVAPQPIPCGTTPTPTNKPSPMQRFPFPGEAGSNSSPNPVSAAPNLNGVPDAPAAPPAAAPKKDFPFPGDAGSADTTKPDAGNSSSSSSSSDDAPTIDADGNPVTPALEDKGTQAAPATSGRHILHRVNPVGTKLQTADEREGEDLDVAHFYVQNGDLKGAYLRTQDAVKTVPDDPDAHFALAEIAQKLNKREEAIAEYNACLKLDPTEKQAKDARKALARLKP